MIKLIPAIDIIDGECVRLTMGDYSQKKTYSTSPLDIARQFEEAGITYLHVVDLDGAKAGKIINLGVVKEIVENTGLKVDFGGGVKKKEDIEELLNIGVDKINIGSLAVKDKPLVFQWIQEFGAEKIILSADSRDGKVSVNGWKTDSGIDLIDFIGDYVEAGIKYVTCTDIHVDGMLTGPSVELYRQLAEKFPTIDLIASGGVSKMGDIHVLNALGIYGVITGKAIYEGKIEMEELEQFIKNHA